MLCGEATGFKLLLINHLIIELMKTQNVNNKLSFNKNSLSELNSNDMNSVKGGTVIIGAENPEGSCIPNPFLIKAFKK